MKALFWLALVAMGLVAGVHGALYALSDSGSALIVAGAVAMLLFVLIAIDGDRLDIGMLGVAFMVGLMLVSNHISPDCALEIIAAVYTSAATAMAAYILAKTEHVPFKMVAVMLCGQTGAIFGWMVLLPHSLPLALAVMAVGIVLMAAASFVRVGVPRMALCTIPIA